MIGSALKKLAKQNNLTISNGVAFGDFHGYAVTFSEGAGTKTMAVTTRGQSPESEQQFLDFVNSHNLKKLFRVIGFDMASNVILVVFHDDPGTMKKIYAFIDWFFPLLKQYSFLPVQYCSECGMTISSNGSWHLIDGIAFHMHEACALQVAASAETQARIDQENDTGTYGRGFLGALLGALLGSVVWAIVLCIGYVASVVGLLIGFLAKKGYELFHGRHGKGKLWIILLASVIGVIAGTFLGDGISLGIMIANGELWGVGYGDIFPLILNLLATDAEYSLAFAGNIAQGLIFALLGMISVIKDTHKETKSFKMKKLD